MTNLFDNLTGIDLNSLPPQIRQLIDNIGLFETYNLLKKRGGCPLYIPANPDQSSLADIISRESLLTLCKVMGGRTVELPKSDKLNELLRNHLIIEDKKKGISNRDIALKHGLTRRWVIQILKQAEKPGSEDLFDRININA